MEIITERHKAPGMIVPVTESESSIRDEVNRRTYKAGYTDSDGQPMVSRSSGAGKGDRRRPTSKRYLKNYVEIFGEQKLNNWPRDEQGNLIN